MKITRVGFIGFGEVASVFSKRMREYGVEVYATDVLLLQPEGEDVVRRRIQAPDIKLGGLEEVVHKAPVILCTVPTQEALTVAQDISGMLTEQHVYIDLSSTSPAGKVRIAQAIAPSGALFVEGAILGAIGVTGADTVILVAGSRAEAVAEALNSVGLKVTFYSEEIGHASMFKMLRSIFSKGLECLIIEFLTAGKRAGLLDDLWEDIVKFMSTNPFVQIANNWVRTHGTAYERRYHEMQQVVATMRELGLEPIMSQATLQFFKRSLQLDLGSQFEGQPSQALEVIDAFDRLLQA